MKKIVLITCTKDKLDRPARVEDLYVSPLFPAYLAYARSLAPDAIYVLSAKHALLELDQVIEPYDLSLLWMNAAQKKAWAARVLASLRQKADLQNDLFVILAGDAYRRYLLPELAHYEIPFKNMPYFKIMHELKRLNSRT